MACYRDNLWQAISFVYLTNGKERDMIHLTNKHTKQIGK